MTLSCPANNLADNAFDFRLLVKMLRLSLKFRKYSLFLAHSSLNSFQHILCLKHGHVPSGLEKEEIRSTLSVFVFLLKLRRFNETQRKRGLISLEGLEEASFLVSPPSSQRGAWSFSFSLLHRYPLPLPLKAYSHKRINTLTARANFLATKH